MKLCLSCRQPYSTQSWQCPGCGSCPEILDGKPFFAPELAEQNDGFPSESFAHLFELESANFWFRSRNQLIIWALNHYFPGAGSFLEIGCGTGYVLNGIRQERQGMQLFGSEIYRRGLEQAATRVDAATLVQIDARQIPFRDEFDVIGAFDVLEHIKEDDRVLAEIHGALKKPGGGLLLTVPQHKFLWSVVDEYSCHLRRYELSELKRKVESAGFKVLRTTSFVSLLLPLMLVSRLFRTGAAKDYDPLSEYRIPAYVNQVLESLLTLERQAIKAGLSYPLGGSLLLVAETV